MQNASRYCHAENNSNPYQALYRTPMVSISSMDLVLSVTPRSRRRPWFPRFRTRLGRCASLDEIETLLNVNVRRWRGSINSSTSQRGVEGAEIIDEDEGSQERGLSLTGFLDDDEVSDSYGIPTLESRSFKDFA
jgi:hypothetical protein